MMLVFNPEWERQWERLKIPLDSEEMIKGLMVLVGSFLSQFWYMVHANMDIGRF